MKVYNYNKNTKEYISTTNATENPLEKGKYLIPANATTIAVGADKAGFTQVFDEANKTWDYVEDNRGKTVYDTTTKQESKVDYLGAIKSGFTELVPSEFDVWNGTKWIVDLVAKQADVDAKANKTIFDELAELDKKSIRDIREWIAAQADAPQGLKNREVEAISKRKMIK